MAKIGWSQAKADYLKDETVSYASIASKYGVSIQSVKKHASKEGWQGLRRQTLQKVDQKLPELVSESLAQTKARHATRGRLLQDKAMAVLQSNKPVESYSDALRMLSTGVRIEREALGLNKDEMSDPLWEKFQQFSFIFSMTEEELERFTKAIDAEIAKREPSNENTPQYSFPPVDLLSDGTSGNTPQTPS